MILLIVLQQINDQSVANDVLFMSAEQPTITVFCISNGMYFYKQLAMQQSICDFDLEYVLAVGEEFKLSKNGRFRNIYEDEFEEVPIKSEADEDDFQVE